MFLSCPAVVRIPPLPLLVNVPELAAALACPRPPLCVVFPPLWAVFPPLWAVFPRALEPPRVATWFWAGLTSFFGLRASLTSFSL